MFDSDTIMITNNKLLIEAAERNYSLFKVPTNMVTAKKTVRYYTSEQKADLDIKTSVNKIGDIINLSQELQTHMWHQLNHGASYKDIEEVYFDICQLAVLSNIEIDSAKKEFDIKSADELAKIKKKWIRKDNEGRVIKPFFFGFLAKEKGFYNSQKKNYLHHDTSMDYLHKIVNGCRMPKSTSNYIEIDEIINLTGYDYNNVRRDNVRKILLMLDDFLSYSNYLFKEHDCSEKYKEYMETKKWLYTEINKLTINTDTLIALYRKLKKDEQLKKYIMTVFFNIGNNQAFKLIKQSSESIPYLISKKDGEVEIYGKRYTKIYKNPNK